MKEVMAQKSKQMKIPPVKGRPMLHWVGKMLPGVRYFPAQLCEKMGVESAAAEI